MKIIFNKLEAYEQEYQTCIGASITLKKGYKPRTNKINDEKGQQN
jgi:hypothetical protein